MDNNIRVFMHILNCSTKDESVITESVKEMILMADWEVIHTLACKGKVVALTFLKARDAISYVMDENPATKDELTKLLKKWESETLYVACSQIIKNHEIIRIIKILNKKSIVPLVFKGIVLSDLYNEDWQRFSADADILANDKYYDICNVLSEEHYIHDDINSKENVAVYKKGNVTFEIHKRLWEDYDNDIIKALERYEVGDIGNSHLIKIDKALMYTMNPIKHLYYLFFHLIKHISYTGTSIRSIMDISLFMQRYSLEIDFTQFVTQMQQLGYSQCAKAVFSICKEFFELDEDLIPVEFTGDSEYAQVMLQRMYENGAITGYNMDYNDTSMSVAYQVSYTEGYHYNKHLSIYMKMLFPGRYNLGPDYVYARNNPLLLPVAWIHRALHNILCTKKLFTVFKSDVNSAKEKINLLNELNISGNINTKENN